MSEPVLRLTGVGKAYNRGTPAEIRVLDGVDLTLMYSVVDIAGLNDILCPILENAAGAVAGMARSYVNA